MTDDPSPLDPTDWADFRAQGHRMLDDILDYLEGIEKRPVWQPIPDATRAAFREPLPQGPSSLTAAHDRFMQQVLPYATGNAHPGFMGWVHGAGTPVGLLAEMLAAGLNANLGGRDHMPIEVERQILRWMRELFGFPESASGLFVTGTSMANLMAVLIARTTVLGYEVRREGLTAGGKRLAAYTSEAAHGCVRQAVDLAGLGSSALRRVATDACQRMDLGALTAAIAQDRRDGFTPFLLVGTGGTVDAGGIDDLAGLAELARRERLWFHVDAAYGALALMAPDLAPLFRGIEQADSIAFDFHKWGQVPYDAGYLLVRDGERHRASFAAPAAYLRRETRGLAAGSPWPCDFGPDLSRGFRALKTWFTLKVHGTAALGAAMSRSCALASYLEQRVAATPALELLAPAQLNIVCFRYRAAQPDAVNAAIVADLHESGIAAPSTTTVAGKLAIRAALVNHRTRPRHIDALLEAVLRFGAARAKA
jgi:glutamate/tyrosine decarboxylase-like PLP-dependent enzyme